MRSNHALRLLPALLLVLFATFLHAQFQQPTPDELKMTVDAQYPDAAAVILDEEDRTDDILHLVSHSVRIKILKDSAKQLATVSLGYLRGNLQIAAVSGRTIHADGTVIPLDVKPADLMRLKQGDTEIHEVVFNLPSVEVGSIIEYYYQLHEPENVCLNPTWEIQTAYPVLRAHYLFAPCRGYLDNSPGISSSWVVDSHGQALTDLIWYTHLPNGQQLQPTAAHRFELTLTDVPPLPHEAFMPPIDSQKYEVRFYYSAGTSVNDYWNKEGRYWLNDVNSIADPTSAIKSAVSGIISPSDPDLAKAQKLYAAVQALDNTAYSRTRSAAEEHHSGKRAEDVWQQKSGTPNQIAFLYLAMLRAAGLTAYPMRIADRERTLFNPDYLNIGQLNSIVIALDIDGKETVLDPGEKLCPFGMVHWRHSGAGGIRQTADGTAFVVTPQLSYKENVTIRRADLNVNSDGSVTGQLSLALTGQQALNWRQESLRVNEDELKGRFGHWLSTQLPTGLTVHTTSFANLTTPDAPLAAEATVSGPLGSIAGKRILLPAAFFDDAETRSFVSEANRQAPVDMNYAAQIKDGVLYHLPAGYSLEAAPPAATIPWAGHAIYLLKAEPNPNGLNVGAALSRAFTFIEPTDYAQLHDFYQKVAAASQQQIVLTSAKGN